MNIKYILTTCPYCGTGCGIYLKVKDGRLIGAMPSKSHIVNKGRVCVKGLNSWEMVQHEDRLKTPLIRNNGRLRSSTWDEALDLVAGRLKDIKDRYGPDSVGVWASACCSNELNFLAQKFARAVLGTNNVDHCARTCHSPTVSGLVAAFGSGAMTNSIDEIKDTKCLFAIGSNASEAHPVIGWRVRDAKDRGANIIICDPRKTEMAKYADIHIQHYPGSDIALLNSLMYVIIKENLHDAKFIEGRTEGFAQFQELLEGYSPQYSSKITGVDEQTLRKAAIMYATSKPASIIYTLGITEHITGTENVLSIANLAMLCGNVGVESAGVNPLRGQCNVQGACDMGALPNVFPGYQKVADSEVRAKFENAWGVRLNPNAGLTTTDQLIGARQGKIKALYVIGEDPLRSEPNTNLVKQAIENLEFLAVQEIFMSPTAEMADVILPGASFAEKEGSFTNSERRVQLIRKAIEPIGDSRPDWQIICELATRTGYPFRYRSSQEVMEEIAQLTPIYSGISHERIRRVGIQWPCPEKGHPGTKFLHQGKFARGLGKFHAIEHRSPAETPDQEYPFFLSTGRILFHYNVGTRTRRTHILEREFPDMIVEINSTDAQKLDIANGARCKISTRRGSLIAKALVNDKTKEGVLWMPFHYAESPANILTIDAFCPISRIGEYKVCAAKLEKISEATPYGARSAT
jgi:formate dehydrogenase alpha subunit